MSSNRVCKLFVSVAMSALLMLGACATEETPEATETEKPAAREPTPAPASVAVTAQDYSFSGIPASIDAGSKLTLQNSSTKEAHEIVAFRLPDTEKRPVAELVKLPEAEQEKIFGSGPPATVIVAPPSSDGMAVLGDGTLKDAGRYALACFVPTGADPQEFLRAAQAPGDQAPVVAGGPPHVTQGMFAEATVK